MDYSHQTKQTMHQPPYNPEGTTPPPYPGGWNPAVTNEHQAAPPVYTATPTVPTVATRIVPTVTVIATPNLNHTPAHLNCLNCGARVTTNVKYVTGGKTHAGAICLFLFCWIIPCLSCLPYCCDSCKTAVHTCPSCGQSLGQHEPI